MLGTNPIRPPENDSGQMLRVKSFFPTLQGEGPLAGTQAVFLRLGGCNLACSFCDTQFEGFSELPLAAVIVQIQRLASDGRRLVVITGGEPLRQNIAPLCEALLAEGFRVQIETNGTLWRELPQAVEIVCSPKNSGGRWHPLRDDLLSRANALKFLVSAHRAEYSQVPDVGQQRYHIPVYIQPMDERDQQRNRENYQLAARLAAQHGYTLSLQMQKIRGIE